MRFWFFPLFCSSLLGVSARADSQPLFLIRKPDNPKNLVQTLASVDSKTCKLGRIDFVWLRFTPGPEEGFYERGPLATTLKAAYQRAVFTKPPAAVLRCNILNRIHEVKVRADSPAGCKVVASGIPCDAKGLSSDEVRKVSNPPTIVVRSVWSESEKRCKVASYADFGAGNVVQIRQLNTNGHADKGFISSTVQFSNVEVVGMDGNVVGAPLRCVRGCREEVNNLEALNCTMR